MALCFQNRLRCISGSAALGDAARHAVEHLHALDGIFASRCLAAQHHCIGLLEDCIGHIGNLRACRHGIFDHAFEHVGRHDDRLSNLDALLDDAALNDRQLLHLAFDAEIPARNHDRVGCQNNVFDKLHRILVLDLGDRARPAAQLRQDPFEFQNIRRFAAKTQRHKINTHLHAEPDIRMVLLRERREADFDARQIDVAPRAHGALGENLATDPVLVFFQHLHVDDPVVHQHRVADMDVIDEAVVVHIHRVILLAARTPDSEFKNISGLQI